MTTLFPNPVYVAPANPAGRKLSVKLAEEGYQVAGLADNLKSASDIINSASQALPGAHIVLAEGTYLHAVAEGLIQRGFSTSCLFVANEAGTLKRYQLPLGYRWNKLTFRLACMIFSLLRTVTPKSGAVYYAESFFDTNVLLAYREHRRTRPSEPVLAGRNMQQKISELDSDSHVFLNFTALVLWRCLRARHLIVDHEFTSKTFTLLRRYIHVVQLWHGLPYKALSGNSHYPDICDHAFISSSRWFNKHIFPEIFRARHYHALGYPRNDALIQTPERRDWVNAESLSTLQRIKRETGKLVIYAPTYRDWGDNNYPLDLPVLQTWCESQQVSLILKFHPFISRQFSDAMDLAAANELQPLPGYDHLYLYPSGKNIYPWLADAAILITDYSSIAYDFLLTQKPVIYYQYDKADYLKLRGETLVSDEDFIAGDIVSTHEELLQALSDNINLRENPKATLLLDKFGVDTTLACKNILKLVSTEK